MFVRTRMVLLVIVFVILTTTLVLKMALAADLTYNSDTDITLSSPNIKLMIVSGSQATSLTVNAGNIVVTIPTGSTFTVKSPSRDLTVAGAPGDTTIATECPSGGVKKVTITSGNTSNASLTITPTDAQCTPTTSGGGGGGGGGGGSSSASPAPVQATTTTATTTQVVVVQQATTSVSGLKAQLQALLAQLLELQAQARARGIAIAAPLLSQGQIPEAARPQVGSYKRPLSFGLSNPDVTALQTLLKALGPDVYPEGIVSGYFGGLTRRAVERFQLKYGIAVGGDPGFGHVGPKTRAKLNSLLPQ